MNIIDQVLSIDQVQELTELGFDVRKNSSMYYTPNWITKFGVDEIQDYLLQIGGLGEDYDGDCIPTMTIGDIVDILPKEIDFKIGIIWFMSIQFLNNKYQVFYFYDKQIARVDSDKKQINALFEALKWVIKYKHIEL